jgi:hypothetical protein
MNKLVKTNEIPNTLAEVLSWSGSYFQITQALQYHISKQTENVFIIGRLLEIAEKQRIWEHDGTCAKSFMHWCTDAIHMKRTTVQRIRTIYQTFAPRLGELGELILSIDKMKLALISSRVSKMTDEQEVIELLYDCQSNSYRALENNLREKSGLIPSDNCDHEFKVKTVEKCIYCGLVIVKGE